MSAESKTGSDRTSTKPKPLRADPSQTSSKRQPKPKSSSPRSSRSGKAIFFFAKRQLLKEKARAAVVYGGAIAACRAELRAVAQRCFRLELAAGTAAASATARLATAGAAGCCKDVGGVLTPSSRPPNHSLPRPRAISIMDPPLPPSSSSSPRAPSSSLDGGDVLNGGGGENHHGLVVGGASECEGQGDNACIHEERVMRDGDSDCSVRPCEPPDPSFYLPLTPSQGCGESNRGHGWSWGCA